MFIRGASVLLFMVHNESPLLGWEEFLKGPNQLEIFSGCHSALLESPNVERVAEKLGHFLTQAERERCHGTN